MIIITFDRVPDASINSHGSRHFFRFHAGGDWAPLCECGHSRRETLTPIQIWEGTEQDPVERSEPIGAALCEWCCLGYDSCGGGWPNLTHEEMIHLWSMVRTEQARDAGLYLDDIHAANRLTTEDLLLLSMAANRIQKEAGK